jgi:N-acetylglucosaminyldiphosphoundecaprenol N-acetyl-beta-D-mannosaminyltransferase
MRELVIILGVPVDNLTPAEALDRLEGFIETGRATGQSHQVVTVNADFVKNGLRDPELRFLLQDADMATADGMPLVWGARLLNVPLKGRLTGVDLVPRLAERAAEKGYSIYLLGGAPGVADLAAKKLLARYPKLKIAGQFSPPVSSVLEMDTSILLSIRAAQPDILLVAFGNPKQEKWIGMYKKQLSVPVMMGVGGTLDFLAGVTTRAPRWMQQSGLEWLFRLIQEPGRLWRRYFSDLIMFGVFFTRQWWVMRRGGAYADMLPVTDLVLADHTAIVRVVGSLTVANYGAFNKLVEQALASTPFILINMSETRFLDSAAIGSLVHFAKRARDAGGELALVQVPAAVRTALSMLRLIEFLTIYPSLDAALAAAPAGESGRAQAALPNLAAAPAQGRTSQWTVIKGARRFDATAAPDMIRTGSDALSQYRYVILDLSETVILTSAGLSALAHLNRIAEEQHGALRVTGCTTDVMQVIEMVRFDKVLSLSRDVNAATA